MVASGFIKLSNGLLWVALCMLLVACGPAAEPPQRQVPIPQQPQAQETGAVIPEDDASVETESIDSQSIRIAILLPLSGPEAEAGTALLNAATLALFDAYDPRLTLLPYDTKADVFETELVARKAVEDGVDIVLGPLLAANVQVAGEIFSLANIPLLGFSNDSSVAAPNRYILGFQPENEVLRVIDYAIDKGLRRFSALVPEGLYGNRVRLAFGDAVSDGKSKVIALESYPPDPDAVFEPVKALANYDQRQKNLRDEIRVLRALGDDVTDEIANALERAEKLEPVDFEAILVPEGGALLRTVGPLLPFYEIDPNTVQLLGTGLWNDPTLMNEPPLHGAWFAAPEPARPDAFMARYETEFGVRPPRISTLAYDAVALVAALSRDTLEEGDSYFSARRLTTPTGFLGVDGLFRLNIDGLNERALAILEITRREFRIIDPAPKVFPSFGYQLRQSVSQEGN